MSVAGSTRTGVTVDDLADSFMPLPRNTLSAVAGHRHARGLDAILLTFDRKVQLALRSLCIERLELEARKRAMLDRIVSNQQAGGGLARTPEILITLNTKILDNDANIRRLAGPASSTLMDALKDPEVIESLQLEVPSEDAAMEGEEARIWRRRLDTHRVSRVDAPYRHGGHDTPSNTGDRDLHNVLSSANPDEKLSYYQKQQLKYGRGRRGSTSIAGPCPAARHAIRRMRAPSWQCTRQCGMRQFVSPACRCRQRLCLPIVAFATRSAAPSLPRAAPPLQVPGTASGTETRRRQPQCLQLPQAPVRVRCRSLS